MVPVDLFLEVGHGNCARGVCTFDVVTLPQRPEMVAAIQRLQFTLLGLTPLVDESIGSLESHREQAQLALAFHEGRFSVWGGDAATVLAWAFANCTREDVLRACLVVVNQLEMAGGLLTKSASLRLAVDVLRSSDDERLPQAEAAAHEVLAWALGGYSDLDMSVPWCDVAVASAVHSLTRFAQGMAISLKRLAEDFASAMELNDARRARRRRQDGRTLALALWPQRDNVHHH